MTSGALFSDDRLYRYALWREWSDGPRMVAICCNPSTAGETVDDPTVAGMVKRAKAWGYGSFTMLNLFAWRSTDPRALKAITDPVWPQTDINICAIAFGSPMVICAWGSCSPLIPARASAVEMMLRDSGVKLHYLKLGKLGKTGTPWHPLYLPHALKPTLWEQTTEGSN